MAVRVYDGQFYSLRLGLPFWLTIPLGWPVTAVVGAVFGVPSTCA
ncbi:hypothetical protein [Candidatus Amarobacter glycogenicus]